MRLMKFLFLFVSLTVFTHCRQKSGSNGEGPVKIEPEDFLAMFHPLSLPSNFQDSILTKKPTDSSLSSAVLEQFIPDSLILRHFGKESETQALRLRKTGGEKCRNLSFYQGPDSFPKDVVCGLPGQGWKIQYRNAPADSRAGI